MREAVEEQTKALGVATLALQTQSQTLVVAVKALLAMAGQAL
jgi:hypothetical protein